MTEKTKEELELDFRKLRAKVLASTDYMFTSDYTGDTTLAAEFRQFLRDVPQNKPNFAYTLEPLTEREKEVVAYGTELMIKLGLLNG